MTKAVLVKHGGAFHAATDEDREAFGFISDGEAVQVSFKRARHLRHHRKAFALLRDMFDNQEHFDNPDSFRTWCKLKIGDVETLIDMDGTTHLIPISWDFASMGQEQFDRTYQKLVTLAYETLGMEILEQYA